MKNWKVCNPKFVGGARRQGHRWVTRRFVTRNTFLYISWDELLEGNW